MGFDHVPVLGELLLRGLLREPVVRPLYLEDPAARERLDACRSMTLDELGGALQP